MHPQDIEIIVESLEKNLPEFCRAADLVYAGLYKSRSDVAWAIKRRQAPPSIKLSSHKVVFPRAALCQWLRDKACNRFKEVEGNDKSCA